MRVVQGPTAMSYKPHAPLTCALDCIDNFNSSYLSGAWSDKPAVCFRIASQPRMSVTCMLGTGDTSIKLIWTGAELFSVHRCNTDTHAWILLAGSFGGNWRSITTCSHICSHYSSCIQISNNKNLSLIWTSCDILCITLNKWFYSVNFMIF